MKLNLNYLKYTNSIDELKDIDVKYEDLPTIESIIDKNVDLKGRYVIKLINDEFQVLPNGDPGSDINFKPSGEDIIVDSYIYIVTEYSDILQDVIYTLEMEVYGKRIHINLSHPDLSELICKYLRLELYKYSITKYNTPFSINVKVKSKMDTSPYIINYTDEEDKEYNEKVYKESIESSIKSYLNIILSGSINVDLSEVEFIYKLKKLI